MKDVQQQLIFISCHEMSMSYSVHVLAILLVLLEVASVFSRNCICKF